MTVPFPIPVQQLETSATACSGSLHNATHFASYNCTVYLCGRGNNTMNLQLWRHVCTTVRSYCSVPMLNLPSLTVVAVHWKICRLLWRLEFFLHVLPKLLVRTQTFWPSGRVWDSDSNKTSPDAIFEFGRSFYGNRGGSPITGVIVYFLRVIFSPLEPAV